MRALRIPRPRAAGITPIPPVASPSRTESEQQATSSPSGSVATNSRSSETAKEVVAYASPAARVDGVAVPNARARPPASGQVPLRPALRPTRPGPAGRSKKEYSSTSRRPLGLPIAGSHGSRQSARDSGRRKVFSRLTGALRPWLRRLQARKTLALRRARPTQCRSPGSRRGPVRQGSRSRYRSRGPRLPNESGANAAAE